MGRALLGVAAGLLMPQLMGIVQQLFPPAERGKAFGVYGMCVSLATALGPSLNWPLVTTPLFGWRGVFVMNVPVAVAILVAAHVLLPAVGRGQGPPRRPDIDVLGLVFGGLALVAAGPGVALALTLYLQEGRGTAPFLAGLVLLPSSATSALGAWLGGRHVVRLGRVLTGTGMLLVLTSTAERWRCCTATSRRRPSSAESRCCNRSRASAVVWWCPPTTP